MGSGPAALAVEDRLFGALAVLRVIVLLNTLAMSIYRPGDFVHPVAGWACVALMVGWTGVAIWAGARAVRRTSLLLGIDLAVAVGLLLVSPIVKGESMQATIPGFWVMGALLAWAIHWRWRGGLVAGLLLAGADLAIRDQVTQANYGNVFLIMIGGPIVGFMAASLMRMADERDVAERAAAAAGERARLARAVHDGVLQVLALVQRRGAELGGEAEELGRLAGAQEVALRALIHRQDALPDRTSAGLSDLAAELVRLDRPRGVSVVTPGAPVLLPTKVGAELLAAVVACLDNVATHVGPEAAAWVLLEEFPDRVEVSIRDEGPGLDPDRPAAAAAEGRLGIAHSIRGRIADLGGTATLLSDESGTEWELSVPRTVASS